MLDQARSCYIDLIGAAARFEPVVVCVDSPAEIPTISERLPPGAAFPVRFAEVPYNDTWVRDSGPLTLLDEAGNPQWSDFRFDAWGGKFEHDLDDQLVGRLVRWPGFAHLPVRRFDWVLEGGAIESDGAGTILTTSRCLQTRYPSWSRDQIDQRLRLALHAERILWLEHGELLGDDTDGHVDTIARLISADTIVYQACEDVTDAHYPGLLALARELESLRTVTGAPYQLVPLPLPAPCHDDTGRRLPAGYANFLILNRGVLMPTYGDAADGEALARLQAAMPEREVIGVDCSVLVTQGGSLHCASMQLPAGTFRDH